MTVKQVIFLMNIKNIPFISQADDVRKDGTLSIYSTERGVCYGENESIWSIGSNQTNKNKHYSIKQKLEQYKPELDGNDRELDKYVAVYEILYVINEYKGANDSFQIDIIEKYVEILNNEILKALDFQQISEMKTLKNLIMENKLYNQMLFSVREVRSTKARQFSEQGVEKKNYCFGNIKYHEELDIVHITIYDDLVEIWCEKEAREKIKRELDIKERFTLEEKIILALNCWKGYYSG